MLAGGSLLLRNQIRWEQAPERNATCNGVMHWRNAVDAIPQLPCGPAARSDFISHFTTLVDQWGPFGYLAYGVTYAVRRGWDERRGGSARLPRKS